MPAKKRKKKNETVQSMQSYRGRVHKAFQHQPGKFKKDMKKLSKLIKKDIASFKKYFSK